MRNPILAKFDDGKPKGERLIFRVEGGLHKIGSQAPYFSITASGHDRGCEFGGCCHEIILEHFPQFKDLVALHLSDIDGKPMHAEANGWFQLAGYFGGAGERYHAGNSERHCPCTPPVDKPWQTTEYRKPTPDECLALWADHVRLPIEQAKRVADAIKAYWNWPDMRAAHRRWIEQQSERWRAEAAQCVAVHGLRVYGDT